MKKISELRKILAEGAMDAQLLRIYSCGKEGLPGRRERVERMLSAFEEFAPGLDSARVFSAPGRTEIGGNHTDHQHGCVLAAAVNMDAVAVAAPNGTNVIRVLSEGYDPFEVDLSVLEPIEAEKDRPAALVRGMVATVAAMGYEVSGFSACVTSDVPGGSGLSSSACFEVLFGTIINGLFCEGKLSDIEIAKAGQFAENNYAMKPSGLLDQATASVGGLVSMDFARKDDPVLGRIEFDFEAHGYTLCVVNTGGNHCDLTPDYAAVPREMKAVARQLGKKLLGDADEELFYAELPRIRTKLGDRAVLRAIHYFDETKRAIAQADCLRADDIEGFLALVNESGRSSDLLLQNGWSPRRSRTQAIPVGLEIARRTLGGKGAYRVHGGGFAGTIQAYVPNGKWDEFVAAMEHVFGKGSVHRLAIRPVGGVELK